jgi:hypothetical protein
VRRFTVFRRGDLSATHNADQVNAPDQPQYEGVVFSDGTTVVRWLTAARSTSVWTDFETMWRIHGHDDPTSKHHTEIVWHDGENVVTVPVLPINAEDERIVEDLIRQHKRLEDYRLRETEKGLVLERRHDPSLGVKP